MLTTKSVLDRVFTRIKDNSGTLRAKMLGWLDSAMRDAWIERRWVFLEKSVTLTITSSAITLPADFGDETFMNVNGLYALTVGDHLSPTEAMKADFRGGEVYGYTKTSTTLTFHPATTGSVVLHYMAKMPDAGYEDGITDTIFPMEFLPLFERSLLTAFYEYDVNADLLPNGVRLDEVQLRKVKKADNLRRPLPPLNPQGMVRER